MQLSVTLSIGYPSANRSDVLEIDDAELAECETEDQREELFSTYVQDWANNYIEFSWGEE